MALTEVQYAAFQNAVWIDTGSGNSGTTYPTGTRAVPVNNLTDALAIASTEGFTAIALLSNLTIPTGTDVTGFTFKGQSKHITTLTVDSNSTTTNCRFEELTISGNLDSNCFVLNCIVNALSGFNGYMENCLLNNVTIVLSGGQNTTLKDCSANIPGATTPVIDLGGSGQSLMTLGFTGGLTLTNKTGSDAVNLNFVSGRLTLTTSVDGSGDIIVQGHTHLTQDTNSTANVIEYNTPGLIWDEPLTGAKHSISTTAGRRLRELAGQVVLTGTALGPAVNGNQIVLDNDASTVDGAYDPAIIAIVNGTGAGQCRLIIEYDGSSKTATVDRTWKVLPDATSEYVIYAHPGREHVNEGLARGGTTNTVTLNPLASDYDNAYVGQTIFLRSGTGEDQARIILAYNGTTKIATVVCNWDVIPDTTTGYAILGHSIYTLDQIYDYEILSGLSIKDFFIAMSRLVGNKIDRDGDVITIYEENGTTIWKQFTLANGGRVEL